jgi:fumarylacetoacetate (FAA) hydrolase
MKFGTRDNETRDGELMVVSRDLQRCLPAGPEVTSLQDALDHWDEALPHLKNISDMLEKDPQLGSKTADQTWRSPLPRAYEWIDGSAYINHVMLVRKARGANPPETLKTDPLIYQGGSGIFLGPKDNIPLADTSWGCDFESEVAVVLGDVPQGTKKTDAEKYIRLVMIVNDVSLRNLIPAELEKGFGFFQSKPASAFAPFAVTPDELGAFWKEGRVHLPLKTWLNGKLFGDPNAGPEMHFSFHDLIAHITKTRSYTAGTILGSGTVSNEDRSRGSSCLAEKRMIEKIDSGTMTTPFLQYGDHVEIEMFDNAGKSIFGRIDQTVTPM